MSDATPPETTDEPSAAPLEPVEETEADRPDGDEPQVTRLAPPVDLEDPADSRIDEVGVAAVPGAPPVSGPLGAPTLPSELPLTPSEPAAEQDEDEVR